MKILGYILSFSAGLFVGGIVTYNYIINKLEEEEIKEEVEIKDETVPQEYKEEDALNMNEYTKRVEDCGYVDYSSDDINDRISKIPYIIKPEEYGELEEEGYDQTTFMLYSDGVLADDNDEALNDEEIAKSVGLDYKEHFGEYEDDSVYIRNDRIRIDYEIIKSEKTYEEVLADSPYLRRD